MCCAEPFRLFFPLGAVAGIIGLALWPLHLLGAMAIYPSIMHARVMTEGFLAAFIIGFLGTAGPRLLSARPFSGVEVATLCALHIAAITAQLSSQIALGDGLFGALLLAFAVVLGRRFVARGNLPPPDFLLVAIGLLLGFVGAVVLAVVNVFPFWPRLYVFGGLALTQGFLLLPVLGVGAFLFPRFLGVPYEEGLAETQKPTPDWRKKALSAVVALAIIVSLAGESIGELRIAGALRFTAAALYIVRQMPSVLKFSRATMLGQLIRTSVWLLLFGLLWPIFLPTYRLAGLHLVFVGGFMLATLTVATRVMLGHSGHRERSRQRLPFMIVTATLLLIGLAARVGADFLPSLTGRNHHLIWAALLCIVAIGVWSWRMLPRVFVPDSEE